MIRLDQTNVQDILAKNDRSCAELKESFTASEKRFWQAIESLKAITARSQTYIDTSAIREIARNEVPSTRRLMIWAASGDR